MDAKPIAIKIKIVAEIKKQELHFAISWKGIYTNKLSFSLGFLELMVSVGFFSLFIVMILCFFFGKLTYVLKEEDTNIIRGIPQIYNDNRNIKQQMATG